uniref:Uncharacterized protein n=1 Tax=Romanomermis culicivorax TaxID=13658 RepID=A0A915J8A4_ROMCU
MLVIFSINFDERFDNISSDNVLSSGRQNGRLAKKKQPKEFEQQELIFYFVEDMEYMLENADFCFFTTIR